MKQALKPWGGLRDGTVHAEASVYLGFGSGFDFGFGFGLALDPCQEYMLYSQNCR